MPDTAGSVIQELISVADATGMDEFSHADLIFAINSVHRLSEEKDIAGFGNNLLNVAMEHSGAVKGLFFLKDNANNIIIQSALTAGKIADKTAFAQSIVNCAAQKQKTIFLGDIFSGSFFCHDSHIKNRQAKSILCIPLVQNGKTGAIVYLEDFKYEKGRTENHLSLLQLILSQASLLLCHIQRYQHKVESEKHYRRLYEQESAKAQSPAKRIFSGTTTHDIRASINAILGYSEILKESLHEGQTPDAGEAADYIDQIISRSWHLLDSINRVLKPAGFGNGPEDLSGEASRFNGRNDLLPNNSGEHAMHGKPSKSAEIIKVKLDYNIESRLHLLEALKKAEQRCLAIRKAMIIRDVDAFGTNIIKIGKSFQSTAIVKWGEALKVHAANFNKEEMELMMQWFPEIVLNVGNRQPCEYDIKMIISKKASVESETLL